MNILETLKKLKRYYKNTIMCMKYPFLYPGTFHTHYYSFYYSNLLSKIYNSYIFTVHIKLEKVDNFANLPNTNKNIEVNGKNIILKYNIKNKVVDFICENKIIQQISISNYINTDVDTFWPNSIDIAISKRPFFINEYTLTIYHSENCETYSNSQVFENGHHFSYDIRYNSILYKYWYSIVNWFYRNPILLLHILPETTWDNSVNYGWRITIAEDLYKELRTELLKHGISWLFKFTILDIKEKWGALDIECGNIPENSDIIKILLKYERLSYTKCIFCGKPADVLTEHNVLPLCNDCLNGEYYSYIRDSGAYQKNPYLENDRKEE